MKLPDTLRQQHGLSPFVEFPQFGSGNGGKILYVIIGIMRKRRSRRVLTL